MSYKIGDDPIISLLPEVTQSPNCGYPILNVAIIETKTQDSEAVFSVVKMQTTEEETGTPPTLVTSSDDLTLLGAKATFTIKASLYDEALQKVITSEALNFELTIE